MSFRGKFCALAMAAPLFALLLGSSGCGAKSTGSSTSVVQPPGNNGGGSTTPIMVALTAENSTSGIVSFYAHISQVQITPRQGAASTLYTAPNTTSSSTQLMNELTHLAGSSEWMTMSGVAPDSYKNLLISVADPVVTYIDSKGNTQTKEYDSFIGSAEVDFPELLNVASAPLELLIDFDLSKSVVLDPKTGNLTLTPTFTMQALPIAASSPLVGTGLVQGELSTVHAYGNGAATLMNDVLWQTVSCNLTSSTDYVNYSASTALPQGALVRADISGQRDSSIDCARLETIDGTSNSAYAVAGTVNSIRGGLAPYQMTVAMQEGAGAGVSAQFLGSGINVNFDTDNGLFPAAANFEIDWSGVDQNNLGITPEFDLLSVFPGQYVEAAATVAISTSTGDNDIGNLPGSMTTVAAIPHADVVRLRKQEEEGTVSKATTDSYGVSRFVMTVASSSVFAQYTLPADPPAGFVPTIDVVVPAGATLSGSLTLPLKGSTISSPYVKVRGLLFNVGGVYTMVAQSVTETLPPTASSSATSSSSSSSARR